VQFSLTAQPADYARLARHVVGFAGRGDPLGRALMEEGAAYIRASLTRLGWTNAEPLVFTGGLGPAYAAHMGLPVTAPQGTALDGALILAGRAAP
jgi:glucosamine kinase